MACLTLVEGVVRDSQRRRRDRVLKSREVGCGRRCRQSPPVCRWRGRRGDDVEVGVVLSNGRLMQVAERSLRHWGIDGDAGGLSAFNGGGDAAAAASWGWPLEHKPYASPLAGRREIGHEAQEFSRSSPTLLRHQARLRSRRTGPGRDQPAAAFTESAQALVHRAKCFQGSR